MENPLHDFFNTSDFRQTSPRSDVCDALFASTDHPDAETIEKRSGASRATVYRTLDTLEKLGAIRAFDFFGDGRTRYEVNTGDGHGHVISESTGEVRDINITPYLDIAGDDVENINNIKLLIVTD